MTRTPHLLFLHGWGFDASLWDGVRAELARRLPHCRQYTHDAGYFGTPQQPTLPPGPVVVIGHSLGALTALTQAPADCIGQVLINGFAHFCRGPEHAHGVAPRVLARMRARLAQDPQAVIDEFRSRCGAPPAPAVQAPTQLAADLARLQHEDASTAMQAQPLPRWLLAGQNDPLIAPAMSAAMPVTHVHWHPGGHLLPLEDSAWCAAQIEAFVRTALPSSAAPQALTHNLIHKPDVIRRFSRQAGQYERHASVQQHAAVALAERIATLPLPRQPRILEIGCGTGLLSRALHARIGPAHWTLTDLSEPMLREAQRGFPADHAVFVCLDGEHPSGLPGHYDVICASLSVQWFDDLSAGLQRLATLLAPGGWLVINTLTQGTFQEWRAAHAALGLQPGTRSYPPPTVLAQALPWHGDIRVETLRTPHANGLSFLRSLKAIGATAPAAGHRPLSARALRAVLAHFDLEHQHVSYEIASAAWRRPPLGVFVTGTDTGVGKTLASAVLTQAWQADYWKPLQTGLADEPGDTETVAMLAQLPPSRRHPPAYALQAPLSPWAAAPLEGVNIDVAALQLPVTTAPLVVEGAGGLMVPIDAHHMMCDLMARFGLPVVLVARSTLGTINHTLLSLQALAARGIPVLGVILNGPPSPGNRQAIAQFGQVRVLAELPPCDALDPQTIATLAQRIPPLAQCLADLPTP